MNAPPDQPTLTFAPNAMGRAQFLRLAAGAATLAMTGAPDPLRAQLAAPVASETPTSRTQAAMLRRPIAANGETLPVIGLGTWQGFDAATGTEHYRRLPAVLQALFDAGGSVIDSSPIRHASVRPRDDCARAA